MPAGEQVELIGRDTDVIERAGIEAAQLAHRAKIADLLAQPAQHPKPRGAGSVTSDGQAEARLCIGLVLSGSKRLAEKLS